MILPGREARDPRDQRVGTPAEGQGGGCDLRSGLGFDLNFVSDPLGPHALLRPSGRGLFLARAFMDELHVRKGDLCGTTVVPVKCLRGLKA